MSNKKRVYMTKARSSFRFFIPAEKLWYGKTTIRTKALLGIFFTPIWKKRVYYFHTSTPIGVAEGQYFFGNTNHN